MLTYRSYILYFMFVHRRYHSMETAMLKDGVEWHFSSWHCKEV